MYLCSRCADVGLQKSTEFWLLSVLKTLNTCPAGISWTYTYAGLKHMPKRHVQVSSSDYLGFSALT